MRNFLVAIIGIAVGVTVAMWLFGSRKPTDQPNVELDAYQLLRQRVVLVRGPLGGEQAKELSNY